MTTPRKTLSTLDAVAMVVGIVIGAGIFRMPPLVASNVDGPATFIGAWIAGGLISLIGALCYAELATTYPNTGGDYHFLMRAFGPATAFLFGWARMTVIQPGSIALLSFATGDYVANLLLEQDASAGSRVFVSSATAAGIVIVLTAINLAGVRESRWTQKVLSLLLVAGLLLIITAGVFVFMRGDISPSPAPESTENAFGMAMIFVLFTYSGWNEAAYLSAEMKGGRRSIVAGLIIGIVTVMMLYVFVNAAYVLALGMPAVRASQAVAADTLQAAWGATGAVVITAILIAAALSTANGTVFTGARSNYALGRDFPLFRLLAQWSDRTSTPRHALLVQGAIALVLVGAGAFTRSGVESMVEYTSPVFWFFFLMAGISFFVLRYKDPRAERPFRVPLYPVLPAVFCVAAAYLLYSSLAYFQRAALVGAGVLLAGVPFMLIAIATRGASGAEVAPLADPAKTGDD